MYIYTHAMVYLISERLSAPIYVTFTQTKLLSLKFANSGKFHLLHKMWIIVYLPIIKHDRVLTIFFWTYHLFLYILCFEANEKKVKRKSWDFLQTKMHEIAVLIYSIQEVMSTNEFEINFYPFYHLLSLAYMSIE